MIIALNQIGPHDLPQVGAKAFNLARLIRAGLPVPAGFCITAAAYQQHIRSAGLESRPGTATPQQLRDAIVAAPLPEELGALIAGQLDRLAAECGTSAEALQLAVRSSATAEDQPARSFAGQYDTALGITGAADCLAAVKRCWASLWSERAQRYREAGDISHSGLSMAVIVQQLVPADCAGVLFTADPVTGRTDRLIIESASGLGGALVSGTVAPDRVVLSKPQLEVWHREVATPGVSLQRDCSLDNAAAAQLGRLALRAEKLFGFPLDLEWAIADGQPSLLQARPVTALPLGEPAGGVQVWTNANTGEILPDVVTPMTWSLIEPAVDLLLGSFFAKLGLDLRGHALLGLIAGRAYFNLSVLASCVRRIPGLSRIGLTELLGGRQSDPEMVQAVRTAQRHAAEVGVNRLRMVAHLPEMLLKLLAYNPASGYAVIATHREKADRLQRTDWQSLGDEALASRIVSEIEDIGDTRPASDLMGMSVFYQGALYELCNRWFGEEGNARASQLLSGLGTNEHAQVLPALWQLAQLAHTQPGVAAALRADVDYPQTRQLLGEAVGGGQFLTAWDGLLDTHGHHGRAEHELANPRWIEQPELLLDQVRSHLAAAADEQLSARFESTAGATAALTADWLARLRSPLRRLAFRFVLGKARACAPLREGLRNQVVRRTAVIRRMLLELGRRLADRGVLSGRNDIFMLRYPELKLAATDEGGGNLSELLAARRAQYRLNLDLSPPAVVIGSLEPDRPHPGTPAAETDVLRGVPVNPGRVTGPARVILRAEAGQVLPGEILVAPFTDPGWTPLFLSAAAIVMDMGGVLSHGSIVAREYGIPAVVNVGPASAIIRTGQLIEVDGTRGTVRILARS